MFFLFPLSVETRERHQPFANWVIIALTVMAFIVTGGSEILSEEAENPFILKDWSPSGMLGYMFLHGGFWHLAGNMIFLWVFGNAICQTTGSIIYPFLYFGTGLCAAALHLMLEDSWALGASGAVSGITGLAMMMFPFNDVKILYVYGMHGGTFKIKVITLCVVSFLMDLFGTLIGDSGTAHWAHIGGLLSGVVIGFFCLRYRWIVLARTDNKSLYEMLTGRELERVPVTMNTGRRNYEGPALSSRTPHQFTEPAKKRR